MKYAFCGGKLLDGTREMQPREGLVLRTDGDRITDIVPEGTDLTGYEVVDLGKQVPAETIITRAVEEKADAIGLSANLSPTRSNGLLAMVRQMRLYALAFSKK